VQPFPQTARQTRKQEFDNAGQNVMVERVAITKGLWFLLERQSSDGAWRDFALEPGTSDAWTTAYIAGCLSQVTEGDESIEISSALRSAAHWLTTAMRPDGGWGYNANAPVDSDSTALAILFLSTIIDVFVPAKSYERLTRFQNDDGGFATFERAGASNTWGMSHPDVTPTALRALLTRFSWDDAIVRRGLAHSRATLNEEHLWDSYWWTTPLYATLANIRLLEEGQISYDRQNVLRAVRDLPISTNVFEVALRGEILGMIDRANPRLIQIRDYLKDAQHPDGKWRANSPILRVTDPRCRTPWREANAGLLVSDPHNLFTTATVLHSLRRIMDPPLLG
jgi:hypothetical protein